MAYDFADLNDSEVNDLIRQLKHPSEIFTLNEINRKLSALFGNIDITESIIGTSDKIEYKLHIFRGKRDRHRFSIHLRFKKTHNHLVRVDIGSGHNNPDGSKIEGSHIHIYNNSYDKRDHFAIPLEESDFPNVQTIVDAFHAFVLYNNIRNEN
nr:hypothetical protein [Carnobacterium maltaromaticum]